METPRPTPCEEITDNCGPLRINLINHLMIDRYYHLLIQVLPPGAPAGCAGIVLRPSPLSFFLFFWGGGEGEGVCDGGFSIS